MDTKNILELAARMQDTAVQIIDKADIYNIWRSIGAEINLVGSVKTGLLMKHRDIDFHIYSAPLQIEQSFAAMARLACDSNVKRIEYINLIDTDEHCIEWHAWYLGPDEQLWQIDMIHIQKGTFFDGYMERVADRINELMTPELRLAILQMKYDTPESEKIMGIEYYKAAIRDGVRIYPELVRWRKENAEQGVTIWMP